MGCTIKGLIQSVRHVLCEVLLFCLSRVVELRWDEDFGDGGWLSVDDDGDGGCEVEGEGGEGGD